MDNQHKKIKGYRDLTQDEIDGMNAVKAVAIEVGKICDFVDDMPGIDRRLAAIARTDLQNDFERLLRAIAKPETFF